MAKFKLKLSLEIKNLAKVMKLLELFDAVVESIASEIKTESQ
jgi:hypothetical protein